MDKRKVEEAMLSWRHLVKAVTSFNKEEAEYALMLEEMNNNRVTFKDRIQQRLRAIEVEDSRNKWR